MKYLKVFTDFQEIMEPLDDGEKGRLFSAMLQYAEAGTEPRLEGNERFVWAMARRIIDREAEVYESKVEAAREAGRKSGEARRKLNQGEPGPTGGNEDEPKGTNVDRTNQENENENKKENINEYDQEYVCKENGPADTHTPSREEIAKYCQERQNGIDPEYFYNYYQATGWRVGQNPMRDWRAAVRAWEKRDAQRGSGPGSIGGAVRSVLDTAQAKRSARQRNTLLNYREQPSHFSLESIAFDPDEL